MGTAAGSITQTGFNATWTAPSGSVALTYRLDVATTFNFQAGTFVSGYNTLNVGNVLTYTVSVPNLGTNYYYRVTAVNSQGSSAYSNVITVIVPATAPTISVTGYPHNSSYNFGSVYWGINSDKVFTISNTGTANLAISNIQVSGTGYSIIGTYTATLAAGASTTLTVRFTPNMVGALSGTLSITSNDNTTANGSGTYLINLTGTGIANNTASISENATSYSSLIPYISNQAVPIVSGTTSGLVKVFSLSLSDGVSDADNLTTILNSLTLTAQNTSGTDVSSQFRGIALATTEAAFLQLEPFPAEI